MMFQNRSKLSWGVIGQNPKRNDLTSLPAMRSRSEGFDDDQGTMLGGIDLYFTPNQFFQWKCTKQLSQLHANYIDIDTPKHEPVSSSKSKQILHNALGQLKDGNIPPPNAIVSSGSGGWHVYWIYNPVTGHIPFQTKWRQIAAKILESIDSNKNLNVDTAASSDPTRLLRLPGSFHFKAKDQCQCIHLSHKYDFDQLYSELQLEPIAPTPSKLNSKPTGAPKNHNIKDYWSKIYYQLLDVANRGQIKKPKEINRDESLKGNRDLFLFLSMVALQHIYGSYEIALNKVLSLNEKYRLFDNKGRDSNPNQVKRYLSTCENVHYKYGKEKLIKIFSDHFNTDISHIFAQPKEVLSPEEVLKRQITSAHKTHQSRKEKTQDCIKTALMEIHSAGNKPSMSKVASLAKISKRTVANHANFYNKQIGALWSLSI